MRLRDMIRVRKKDLGNSIEVEAELRVISTFAVSSDKVLSEVLDPFEEAKKRAIDQIDEDVFGEARRAYEEFEQEIMFHLSDEVLKNPKLMTELKEMSERVHQFLYLR